MIRAQPSQHPPSVCVPQVDLYENGTIAIVEAVSPELGNRVQRVRVQLPGTSSGENTWLLGMLLIIGGYRGLQGCHTVLLLTTGLQPCCV